MADAAGRPPRPAGLDPLAAAALRDDLAALVSRKHITVFLTTHNLQEAETLCRHVAVLRDGKLLATGTPREVRAGSRETHVDIVGRGFHADLVATVRSRPEVDCVSVDDTGSALAVELRPDANVGALVALVVGRGAEVEEVRRGQASLEDAFRALVLEDS